MTNFEQPGMSPETTPEPSRVETIGRMMEQRAQFGQARRYTEQDVALLLETLDELHLTMNDLSLDELHELGDIEAGLYQRYLTSNEEENE